MNFEELKRITESVGERDGWDFSRVREAREPVPWNYIEVVRRYLEPEHRVLDIGTGGGECFLAFAPHFGTGVGIDLDLKIIETARRNTSQTLQDDVSFRVMDGVALDFPDDTFDVVLNRHAPVFVEEIVRVLRPEGVFITQQVGPNNTCNLCEVFGCRPGGEYEDDPSQRPSVLEEVFCRHGCEIVCRAEYDVRSWFLDIESFIFWLKAVPFPEDFDIERHGREVEEILERFSTPRGIETNEQRSLLITKKR